jgi:hypothetical protein
VLGLVVLALLELACARNAPNQAPSMSRLTVQEREWRKARVRDYQFSFREECFCQGSYVWSRITVVGEKVVSVEPDTGSAVLRLQVRRPTIDSLFSWLQDAYRQTPELIAVTYDRRFHFPAKAEIDFSRNILDDEHSFEVRDFVPVAQR